VKHIIIVSLAVSQVACATIVRGVSEPFEVITEPKGAVVTSTLETESSKKARSLNPNLEPQYYGCEPTPCSFIIPRRSKFVARIEKEGYNTAQIIIRSSANLTGKTAGLAVPVTTATVGGVATATSAGGLLGVNTTLTALNATSAGILTMPVIAIDATSGGMLSLSPNPVLINLRPDSEAKTISYDLDTLSDGHDTYGKKSNTQRLNHK